MVVGEEYMLVGDVVIMEVVGEGVEVMVVVVGEEVGLVGKMFFVVVGEEVALVGVYSGDCWKSSCP